MAITAMTSKLPVIFVSSSSPLTVRKAVLTGDELANSTCSFQCALHSLQGHSSNIDKEVDEGEENAVYRIERALERGEYDLEDGGDEIFEGSDD